MPRVSSIQIFRDHREQAQACDHGWLNQFAKSPMRATAPITPQKSARRKRIDYAAQRGPFAELPEKFVVAMFPSRRGCKRKFLMRAPKSMGRTVWTDEITTTTSVPENCSSSKVITSPVPSTSATVRDQIRSRSPGPAAPTAAYGSWCANTAHRHPPKGRCEAPGEAQRNVISRSRGSAPHRLRDGRG